MIRGLGGAENPVSQLRMEGLSISATQPCPHGVRLPMTRVGTWIVKEAFPPVLLFGVALLAWEGAVRMLAIPPILLPGPIRVGQIAIRDAVILLQAMAYTGTVALCGLASSLLMGTMVAIAFSQSRWIRAGGFPYAIFLQTVPIVAIAPLIVFWFGRGFPSLVLTSLIISLFPIIANGTTGLLSIDADLLDLFRLNNATRWQVLWKLRFPNAVPALCTGMRTAAGMAVVGAIVGEFFVGHVGKRAGLGTRILFTSDGRTAELLACVLASTFLGVLIFGSATLLTAAVQRRWYDGPVEHRV